MQRVGLFVDADDAAIATVLYRTPIDILQFHGHETAERVAEAKERFRRPVMKAISVAAPDDVVAAADYEEIADLLLFDAKPPRRARHQSKLPIIASPNAMRAAFSPERKFQRSTPRLNEAPA